MDYEALHSLNDQLIYAAITGFGETGPWRDLPGYEQIVAAKSGRMTTYDGVRPRDRCSPRCPSPHMGRGCWPRSGSWPASRPPPPARGRGQRVHTSLLHALSVYDMTSGHGNRTNLPPQPGKVYGIMRVPFMTAPTKDGRFIQMCSRQAHHYRRWLTELGLQGMLDDPELANAPDLWPSEERLAEVIEAIRSAMAERTAEEWMEVFSAIDIGGDPFLAPREFLDHPQCTENKRRQEVLDPDMGPTVQIGPLGLYSDTPSVVGPPSPSLGEHTDEVLDSWLSALSPTQLADQAHRSPHAGATDLLPLADVTILDVGYFYACPFAATLLAEAGARVIKVEPPTGDPGRRNWTTDYVKSLVGKESIVLDLKTPEGLDIVYRLVDQADVFLHNFRPGTPERLGIGADSVLARNPRLLYVYASVLRQPRPLGPHRPGSTRRPTPSPVPGLWSREIRTRPATAPMAIPPRPWPPRRPSWRAYWPGRRTDLGQKLETTMLTATGLRGGGVGRSALGPRSAGGGPWAIRLPRLSAPVRDQQRVAGAGYTPQDRERRALAAVLGVDLPGVAHSGDRGSAGRRAPGGLG